MDRFFLEKLVLQVGGVVAIAGILGGFTLAYNGTYSSVSSLEASVDEGWSRLSQDLQERYGSIPEVVNTSRTSAASGASVLDEAALAWDRWDRVAGSGDILRISQATEELEAAAGRLLVILNASPRLRESRAATDFLGGLSVTGGRISADRERYNRAVQDYNLAIRSFPASLWVDNWGFHEREPFPAAIG